MSSGAQLLSILLTSPLSGALGCRSYEKTMRYRSCLNPWQEPEGPTVR